MAPVCGVESKIGLAGGHSFALRAELPKYIRRAGTTNGTSRKTPDVCGRLVSTYSGQSSAGQSIAFYGSRCIFSTSTRAGSNRFNVQWQRSLSTAGLVLRHGQIAAKLAMGTTRLESFTFNCPFQGTIEYFRVFFFLFLDIGVVGWYKTAYTWKSENKIFMNQVGNKLGNN